MLLSVLSPGFLCFLQVSLRTLGEVLRLWALMEWWNNCIRTSISFLLFVPCSSLKQRRIKQALLMCICVCVQKVDVRCLYLKTAQCPYCGRAYAQSNLLVVRFGKNTKMTQMPSAWQLYYVGNCWLPLVIHTKLAGNRAEQNSQEGTKYGVAGDRP